MNNLLSKIITFLRGKPVSSQTREITTSTVREMTCPYCASADCVRRGTRRKKLETVQLYLCKACGKTFTPHLTRGKHYPLNIMLDAISTYNLGYSLEETCRIINSNSTKKSARADSGGPTQVGSNLACHLSGSLPKRSANVKGVEVAGFAPPVYHLQPSGQQKTASFEAVPVGKGDATSPIPDTWPNTTTSVSPSSSNRRREGDLHSIPTRIGTQSVSEMAPSAGVYPPPRPVYHLQPSTLC